MHIPLKKVHSIIGVVGQSKPVGEGPDSHLRQEQPGHAVDHGCGISNPQSLSNHAIGNEVVKVLQDLKEVRPFWRQYKNMVDEGG